MTTRLRPISTLALATALAAQSVGPAAAQLDGIDAADQSTLTRRMETVLARDGAEMGGDVEAVLDYVRTHVRPEPYEGVLKGAAATLLTGSGNGADQTLLAASLLDASDVAPDHRFASCELEAAVVSGLTGEAATGPGSLLLDHAGRSQPRSMIRTYGPSSSRQPRLSERLMQPARQAQSYWQASSELRAGCRL